MVEVLRFLSKLQEKKQGSGRQDLLNEMIQCWQEMPLISFIANRHNTNYFLILLFSNLVNNYQTFKLTYGQLSSNIDSLKKNPKNLWYSQVSLARNVDCIIALKLCYTIQIKKTELLAMKVHQESKISGIKPANQYNKLK